MKVSEQIKEIVKHKDLTITELAFLMKTSQANLANKLVRDKFRLSDINEMLKAIGYEDIEIVARDNNETVIIKNEEVIFKPNTNYLVFDETTSLIEEIQKNGFRDTTFRQLVFECIIDNARETIESVFDKSLLDSYVPDSFKDDFKNIIKNRIPTIDSPHLGDLDKED